MVRLVSASKERCSITFQVVNLPNIELYRDTVAYNRPERKTARIYAEEYGVVFDDFDFDARRTWRFATAEMAATVRLFTTSISSIRSRAALSKIED